MMCELINYINYDYISIPCTPMISLNSKLQGIIYLN